MVRRTTLGWKAWGSLLLVGLGVGCSLWVQQEKTGFRCVVSDAGDDPCPKGQMCVDGRCRVDKKSDAGMVDACAGGPNDKPEVCNGVDDNCNGIIDEGQDFDGDGVTWCGGGVRSKADCDDFDPNTAPGKPERCDGRDNDCDGKVDEQDPGEPPLCPSGQECLEQHCVKPSCLFEGSSVQCPDGTRCSPSGKCIEGDCTQTGCNTGEQCDPASGACVGHAKGNGEACAENYECESGSCAPSDAFGMNASPDRVCARSCCSDADCGQDEFCFAAGTGARTCLPRTMDPRGADASPACGAATDCKAESCVANTALTIHGDGFVDVTGLTSTVCEPPVGGDVATALCFTDGQCKSGLCEPVFGGVIPQCTVPCGTTAQCVDSVGDSAVCRYRPIVNTDSPYFNAICVIGSWSLGGSGAQGAACTSARDCRDGACIAPVGGRSGFCADTCCSDSQCSGRDRCRPIAFGDHYEMRCVP